MRASIACCILLAAAATLPQVFRGSACAEAEADGAGLEAGFAETDITPKVGGTPVYMAGFGQNRKATGVHDPLKARAVVLKEGERKLALVSIDVVGYSLPNVVAVRRQPGGKSTTKLATGSRIVWCERIVHVPLQRAQRTDADVVTFLHS